MKKIYSVPVIEMIKLDNEISLVLASGDAPPFGPDEVKNNVVPGYFNNNPYEKNV